MVERVLTSCARMPAGDIEPLMTLLRRYATEAAREEARLFCDELVEMDNLSGQRYRPRAAWRLSAVALRPRKRMLQ